MKNIFLLVGPSGSGKTSIVRELDERFGYLELWSYTTRPQRYPGEPGHEFVSEQEFNALENICAYTRYNDYQYGVTQQQIDEYDVYVIDIDGVRYMREHYHGNKSVKVIGITIPEEERRARMRQRGDSGYAIEKRILLDREAFADLLEVSDVVFRNTDLSETVECIAAYIRTTDTKWE